MPRAPAISADRLWSRLMALGADGALPGGGVNRQALSAEDIAARRRVLGWAAQAGLRGAADEAGNLFLTLPGASPDLPPVLAGSHLDSQPTGGLFDGAFGVLAALEAVTAIAEAGLRPARPITVVAWANEEGSRFAPGMTGSELFAGTRRLDEVLPVTDADDVSVAAALRTVRDAFPDLDHRALGFPVHSYLEPHIEQGTVLERAGAVIGAVTGLQGKKTAELLIEGREAHAGTEPMDTRRDALQAFARVAARLGREMVVDDRVRFTIGRVEVEPNAPSVVPARVRARTDLRHPDNAVLDRLGETLETVLAEEAPPCRASLRRLADAPSNAFDETLRAAIRRAAARHGLAALDLPSAAGHDARQLAPLAPSAMIFIPCRGGLSHHPDEWAEPAHVAAGAAVLLDLLVEQAGPLSAEEVR